MRSECYNSSARSEVVELLWNRSETYEVRHQYKQRSFQGVVLLCKPRLSASSNVVISKIAFGDVFPNSFVPVSLFFNTLSELESR